MKIPKLPFKLPDISGDLKGMFNFSRKEIIIVAAVIATALVSAVIITSVVLSSSGRTSVTSEKNKNKIVSNETAVPLSERPFLSDFMLYDDGLEESFTGIIYSREPAEKWSDEQVEKYWIDPRIITADQLELKSKKIILDIFADVP